MHMFFDTETSDLPRNWNAPVSDFDSWPRLVQIAWIVCDDQGRAEETHLHLIKPDGFKIAAGAYNTHHISTKHALEHGVELQPVLDLFCEDLQRSQYLVAHNINFDAAIVGAELLRAKRQNLIPGKELRCTMRESTDFCQLPGPRGFKWPSLDQLHRKLFGKGFANADDAAADTTACMRCFFELKKRGEVK